MIKALIIDDEKLARDVLEEYISKNAVIELVGSFSSAEESISCLQSNNIDLIFLDIQMPGLDGISFLKSLRNPPDVIFTTAHRNFALEGFELDATDFLLKPIRYQRFLKAVNKVVFRESVKDGKQENTATEQNDYVLLYSNKMAHRVKLNDITYAEALSDYCKVYLSNRKCIVVKESLNDLNEKLQSGGFLRIHKSYAVAMPKIKKFSSSKVYLEGIELPIGSTYRAQVKSSLEQDKRIG